MALSRFLMTTRLNLASCSLTCYSLLFFILPPLHARIGRCIFCTYYLYMFVLYHSCLCFFSSMIINDISCLLNKIEIESLFVLISSYIPSPHMQAYEIKNLEKDACYVSTWIILERREYAIIEKKKGNKNLLALANLLMRIYFVTSIWK